MIVVVFFIKNAEEESGSKLFEIVRKKKKMPERSTEKENLCIWLTF